MLCCARYGLELLKWPWQAQGFYAPRLVGNSGIVIGLSVADHSILEEVSRDPGNSMLPTTYACRRKDPSCFLPRVSALLALELL